MDNAGLLSFMTFNWLTSLAISAHKKGQLFLEDVWAVSEWESCETNRRRLVPSEGRGQGVVECAGVAECDRAPCLSPWLCRLTGLWEEECEAQGGQASLHHVVWAFCRTRLLLSIVCLMVTQLAGFTGPVSYTPSSVHSPFLPLSHSLPASLSFTLTSNLTSV